MDTDKKEPTELSTVETAETGLQVAPSPLMGIIAAASTDGSVDADKLMKLLEANERYEQNEARKAYHVAMAAFKAAPPKILKDRHVKYETTKGVTEYNHAGLDNATDMINAALSAHGLTASWKTGQKETGQVEVTCFVTHILGHSESCYLFSPPDSSGGKNAIQGIGSAITYLERYTLLAITGLATSDMDDDGNGAGNGAKGPPKPTDEEQKRMDAMCDAMAFFVPDGMTLDRERVNVVVYARVKHYAPENKSADSCAKWLVDILNKDDSWATVCQKPS